MDETIQLYQPRKATHVDGDRIERFNVACASTLRAPLRPLSTVLSKALLVRTLPAIAALAALFLAVGCATTKGPVNVSATPAPSFQSSDPAIRGYRQREAQAFIEFCVELDNQDDRVAAKKAGKPKPNFDAQINTAEWTLLFDSRRSVADDVYRYSKSVRPEKDDEPWAKLYTEIISRANKTNPKGWNADDIFNDATLNGFGPWGNAWLLYQGHGPFAGTYAIAIRGTVFSYQPSAIEDAWFHTVQAVGFLSPIVKFSDSPSASLHSGFAHSTFTLLLDDRYGVLRALDNQKTPAQSTLYLVGHSQGAAMVTLVHAFLHLSMRDEDTRSNPVLGLKGKDYRLKSYGFAQPKPGDYEFSYDFAAITQRDDNAIVINNAIDAVPQVPMTLQALGDLNDDFKGSGATEKVIQFFSSTGSRIRRGIAVVAEPFERRSAKGYGYFYHYPDLVMNGSTTLGKDKLASTWNFAPAGHVYFVYGTPGDPKDVFLQHHAWTYRDLIRTQLSD